MKAKKGFLIIIWTITLVCIVVGLLIHIGGYLPFGNGKYITDEESFGSATIKEVKVDVDVANLKVEYGKELRVEYKYPEKFLPKVNFEDGALTVTESYRKSNLIGTTKSTKCDLTITIPEGTKLSVCNIKTDLGEIRVSDIEADDFKLDAALGDVYVNGVKATTANVSLNLGDLDVTNGAYDSLTIDCDLGDIDVDSTFEEMDAHCDLGDITINTKGDVDRNKVKASCDLGSVKVNGEKW